MIDGWLPSVPWPEKVLSAIRLYRQGHVIKWDSIAYGADFSVPVLWHTGATGTEGCGFVKVEKAWQYVLITSQTCDICEEGRTTLRMPWISVAPVYDILPFLKNPGQAKQIRTKGFGYLVPLSHQAFSDPDKLWVADLRVEYPLEKSVLANQEPIEALAAEGDYSYLADKLASRRKRAALDSRVRTFIVKPLGEALADGSIAAGPIDEIRVQSGPVERADLARLHVLVADENALEQLEEQFFAWEERIRVDLPGDLTLLPSSIIRYGDFRYTTARNTSPLDYSDISE